MRRRTTHLPTMIIITGKNAASSVKEEKKAFLQLKKRFVSFAM
jgi:protein subunit release factor A